MFALDNLQGLDSHTGSERESAKGRAVLAGQDVEHDVVVGQTGTDGQHATTESLTQDDNVGAHTVVLRAEHASGAGNTRLHLVGNEQHVVLVAQVEALLQVAIVGHEDAGLALDGLGDESAHLLAILVESFLKRLGIVIGNADEARRQRTVLGIRTGVVTHGDDRHGASVEVALAADNLNLVVLDAFFHSAPAASQLQGRLYALGTRVHRQHTVVAEEVVHELLILTEGFAVEGTAGEAELVGLVFQCLDDAGVTVTLVDGRITGEEVEILLSLYVPHIDALALGEHHRQRMIVVSTVFLFQTHKPLAGRFLCRGFFSCFCCHID